MGKKVNDTLYGGDEIKGDEGDDFSFANRVLINDVVGDGMTNINYLDGDSGFDECHVALTDSWKNCETLFIDGGPAEAGYNKPLLSQFNGEWKTQSRNDD